MVKTPVSQLAKLAQYQKQWLQHHGSHRPALGGTEQFHTNIPPAEMGIGWPNPSHKTGNYHLQMGKKKKT